MPTAAPKPCSTCGALVRDGTTRCDSHKVKTWAKREGERSLGSRPWRRVRELVLTRDAGLCQTCRRAGRVTMATEVHHVVERAAGGSDDPANLEAICMQCHKAEHVARRGGPG